MAISRALLIFSSIIALSFPNPAAEAKSVHRAPSTKTAPSTGSRFLRPLSLHDRIAQLIIVRGYGDYPPGDNAEFRNFTRWIREDHVGGFIVAGRIRNGNVIPAQPFEMAAFIDHMQRVAKTPLLVASDFERGASMRVAETARFPYLMAFGAAHDLSATRELGAATAREARAIGVTWVFAPDADVNNNPDNPIINVRSYGEDPQAVAAGVSAFIEGAHSGAKDYVLVTAKHFPGHGDTAEDSHMQLAKLDQSKERIESVELVPFRAAIEHGVDSIMTAHMAVPAFEPGEMPATVSRNVLTGLLRDELGFKGIIVTDALEMQGIASLYSQGEAAVRAVEAGADALLMPSDPEACIRALMAAVKSGRISRQRIDASAGKIMAAKQRVGLFHSRLVNLDAISEEIEDPAIDQLAQRVADQAITLVKDDKHLFPMPTEDGSCLVIMAEGQFSQRGEVLASELRRSVRDLKVYTVNPAVADDVLTAIATSASQCKQIYAAAFVTVAANRGSVALEGGLNTFMKTLVNGTVPVALIALGNPYLLRDFPDVGSYAATFSTSTTSESAAARAIVGEIPIHGKLPVSIPGLAKIGDGLDVAAKSKIASNRAE
ncbi:MAG: glycoside hydrolase family 3 N-terminal domain-containing protein [Bryobacteraceae bacterium]